jgi:hypothetical protein
LSPEFAGRGPTFKVAGVLALAGLRFCSELGRKPPPLLWLGGFMDRQIIFGQRVLSGIGALGAIALTLFVLAPAAFAADVADGVCPIMVKLLPEVRGYQPEGARAQLVMAVAERFDYDRAKLRQLRGDVDKSTIATCPREREAMLGAMKMKTLAEALF